MVFPVSGFYIFVKELFFLHFIDGGKYITVYFICQRKVNVTHNLFPSLNFLTLNFPMQPFSTLDLMIRTQVMMYNYSKPPHQWGLNSFLVSLFNETYYITSTSSKLYSGYFLYFPSVTWCTVLRTLNVVFNR